MRAPIVLGIAALLGAAVPLHGIPSRAADLRLAPGSAVRVSGTASIGSFTCETSTLRLQSAPGPRPIADVLVPAATLDCGNRIINGHMRATLKATDHPDVSLRLAFPEEAWTREGGTVYLEGTLTLGGVSRPVALDAEVALGGDGTLRVRGRHAIRLSDHGLSTPGFLMKLLTVRDEVAVHFDLRLAR